ncbi:pyridoxamine 5'-phosphate oxidase family protein [Nocardia pseudovaccinii]|uniref:pyridoxamine 5'-phosphate oxidase family protein n=1 Tax=Nocardia pseudovaccinii TaxID=189540 RepID=UPI0007A38804|nr:pyridoxamine 5'-phosphate oxidase family protein [Nocardia pseudovaccinii]
MPNPEPTVAEIQDAIVELLRTEEIGTLATIDSEGRPASSEMHFAGDGLIAYMHTFTYTRKHGQMQENPNVSYSLSYMPPEGYFGRRNTRYLQIQGRAFLVTDPEEIQRVAKISLEQFAWASDTSLYDNVKLPDQGKQIFYRIEPVQGLWADNRVRLFFRKLVEFSEDGKTITNVTDYNVATGRRSR